MLAEYNDFKSVIGDADLNSGLLRKAQESKWKGKATDFEGICVKSMSLSAGLSKKKLLQLALGSLTSAGVPVGDYVLPQLLAYAQEHSAAPKGAGATKPLLADASDSAACAAVVAVPTTAAAGSAGPEEKPPTRKRARGSTKS